MTAKDSTHAFWVCYCDSSVSGTQYNGYINGSSKGAGTNSIPASYTGHSPIIRSISSTGFTIVSADSGAISTYGSTTYWWASK